MSTSLGGLDTCTGSGVGSEARTRSGVAAIVGVAGRADELLIGLSTFLLSEFGVVSLNDSIWENRLNSLN